jgi:hypothetical protein
MASRLLPRVPFLQNIFRSLQSPGPFYDRQLALGLCSICASFDYERALESDFEPDPFSRSYRQFLHDHQTLRLDPSCPLCRFLLDVIQRKVTQLQAPDQLIYSVKIFANTVPMGLQNWPSISLPQFDIYIDIVQSVREQTFRNILWM